MRLAPLGAFPRDGSQRQDATFGAHCVGRWKRLLSTAALVCDSLFPGFSDWVALGTGPQSTELLLPSARAGCGRDAADVTTALISHELARAGYWQFVMTLEASNEPSSTILAI